MHFLREKPASQADLYGISSKRAGFVPAFLFNQTITETATLDYYYLLILIQSLYQVLLKEKKPASQTDLLAFFLMVFFHTIV